MTFVIAEMSAILGAFLLMVLLPVSGSVFFGPIYPLLARITNGSSWRFDPFMNKGDNGTKDARRFFSSWASRALENGFVPLIVFLIFLLSHPYRGIVQDANLYIGRAVADLDPNGVGRDLMFIHDGQFAFSLFRMIALLMVKSLGLATAAKSLAILAAIVWFFALSFFVRSFASGGVVWVAVLFTVLFPSTYGPPYPFNYAELIAIPRPFSEALVFCGLAALTIRRDGVAALCLLLSTLLHPIMAIAGISVLISLRCWEDRRFIWLCALGLLLTISAGALGLPLVDRLFTVFEPGLRHFHEMRSPYLFPSLWPPESFSSLIVQMATIAIAASFQSGRRGTILAAIVFVGPCGIAASAIFGDYLSSVLILQMQPWRMAWLIAAAGAMSFGLCTVKLWPAKTTGRVVLALLVLAWSFESQWTVCVPTALLALALHFTQGRYSELFTPRRVTNFLILSLILSSIWLVRSNVFLWDFCLSAPEGKGLYESVLLRGFLILPICATAAYLAIAKPSISRIGQALSLAALFIVVVVFWDHRSAIQKMNEEGRVPSDIFNLIKDRPGEILWINGLTEPWFLLGQPQWVSPVQGAPTLFSNSLAEEWQGRVRILMDLRLIDQQTLTPFTPDPPNGADLPLLSAPSVQKLCMRNDAPVWIIIPLEEGKEHTVGLEMTTWRLPEPIPQLTKGDGTYTWKKISAYAGIPCAGQTHFQPR